MSRKSTRQSKPNPGQYKEGTMAHELSSRELKRLRARQRKIGKVVGTFAGVVTMVGLGAHQLKEMDNNHKQSVAVEAARDAINAGRANQVDLNTNVYLREGVTVRTEPKVIDGHAPGERGNELTTVADGEVLVVSNPVTVENEDGSMFMMFTLEDGRVAYVSKEVFGQEDKDGNRYAFSAPSEAELPEGLNAESLEFNGDGGVFTLDGNIVSSARIMTPEQAFEDLA